MSGLVPLDGGGANRKSARRTADQLRANSKLTATEYSFPALGLIFLRHAHSRFKAAEVKVLASVPGHPQRGRRPVTKGGFPQAKAVYLPDNARWGYLASLPESADIGEAIDETVRATERDCKVLEGAPAQAGPYI